MKKVQIHPSKSPSPPTDRVSNTQEDPSQKSNQEDFKKAEKSVDSPDSSSKNTISNKENTTTRSKENLKTKLEESPDSSPPSPPSSPTDRVSNTQENPSQKSNQEDFKTNSKESPTPLQQIQTLQQLSEKHPQEYTYPLQKLKIEIEQNFKKPTIQKYRKYFQSYENLIESFPDTKEIYWDFFYFIQAYVTLIKDTPFHDPEIPKQALNLLNNMELKFKGDKKIPLHLCSYLIMFNFYEEGLQKCDQAIAMNPEEPLPYLLRFQHSKESQKKDLLLILRKFPSKPQVLHFIGNYFKNKKNDRLSIQYLKKASQKAPQSIDILIDLADALFQNESYEEALSYYIRSCQINSSKVKSHFRKSKSNLSQKSLFNLANTYQTHLNTCIL